MFRRSVFGFFGIMVSAFLCIGSPLSVFAASSTSLEIRSLPPANLFFSPAQQSILEDSEFDVSLYLNTNGGSINTMELTVQFPPDKLTLVKPSAGTSLIQLWVEPPSYSNKDGVVRFVGVIPNGVATKSGLISTLTFRAIGIGNAPISIKANSRILANDGLGSQVETGFGRATIEITPKPPEGVPIFSETHPFSNEWKNNTNAIFGWETAVTSTDFSYILDDKPFTVPDNEPESANLTASFENLNEGLWYFHIKSRRLGVWGAPTHYLVRIDSSPPAAFTPKVDYLKTSFWDRTPPKALLSFFTTDHLSGVDHYEVAIIDTDADSFVSPVFIQTESPYQLPTDYSESFRVIVRAIDRAGNIRDESIDIVNAPSSVRMIFDNIQMILFLVLLSILLLIIIHYLWGHHILAHLGRIFALLRSEKRLHEEELSVRPIKKSRSKKS
jgi:hypothetical protein